jgi:geranylgeranyl diphosphate synthase type II
VALLAGDALLAEAFRLALSYRTSGVARELVGATLGMIGGQWRELDEDGTREQIHRLKTGALFHASIGCALAAMEMPADEQEPWRAFAAELGMLFQVVDDILDGDGYVLDVGADGARRLADEAAERAQARLAEIDGDTDVLAGIVDGLATRTA